MRKISIIILTLLITIACQPEHKYTIDTKILASLGEKYKIEFSEMAVSFENEITKNATNLQAWLGMADSYILLYVFGYLPRQETIPHMRLALTQTSNLDSAHTDVLKLKGIVHFLDWEWEKAKQAFVQSIQMEPKNLNARHWYSLWLSAMGRFDEAMAQSDTIMAMDENDDYLVGRSSLLYFQYRFEEMKPLMFKSINQKPDEPWSYDWLGMAYNGLAEHEDALSTYFKAFELSDGTVEVGGGLGHALGHAGETKLAKQLADYYAVAAMDNYLSPVQRSFIHLGIGEKDEAIQLLKQAYAEQSWFLIFMQIEHWYDPIREDHRFKKIMDKMQFPKS